ncbi:hypothetical protein B0H11DRAFT_1922115 [Mycena galericulata]|nr:hypothetical protein B0H11DRAFT_1922115 [Mycena galericulata]
MSRADPSVITLQWRFYYACRVSAAAAFRFALLEQFGVKDALIYPLSLSGQDFTTLARDQQLIWTPSRTMYGDRAAHRRKTPKLAEICRESPKSPKFSPQAVFLNKIFGLRRKQYEICASGEEVVTYQMFLSGFGTGLHRILGKIVGI